RRMAASGYEITHFSCGFKDSEPEKTIDGVRYVRGSQNPLKVLLDARKYYRENSSFDWVVDQRNTHHFFTNHWLPKHQKRALFVHQTTRELWHSEFPWGLSHIGLWHEHYTLRKTKHYPVITVSPSTRDELVRDFGYSEENIAVFHEGLSKSPPPLESLPPKFEEPTFIYVGRFSRYKGIDAAIEAFALFYLKYGQGQMYITGKKNEKFEREIWTPLKKKYDFLQSRVTITGFVSEARRDELMARSHAILVPSQREGWGLIITEANAQNTPAIVYPSPGIRDAVALGKTGLISKEKTPESLFEEMVKLWEDTALREDLTQKARTWSEDFSWDKAGDQGIAFFASKS
ncbi:MAG TPA: glycosyltransferase family 4 protein, partial [Candidatus Gracilibacteria bacterium]